VENMSSRGEAMSLETPFPLDSLVDASYLQVSNRLDLLRATAKEVSWNDYSRLLFVSDFHMGYGPESPKDDFYKNSALCLNVLKDYKGRGFHVIGVGDILDLWENDNQGRIIKQYQTIIDLIGLFLKGNHDNILPHEEAVIYRHMDTGREILVCHGHQGDVLTDQLWKIGRWITQNWGRAQEVMGISDPTGWKIKKHEEQADKLRQWAQENIPLIHGHIHIAKFEEFENGNFDADCGSGVGDGLQATVIEDGQIISRRFS
jgi:UDP-2,3-diacylglucosamine pyrophosphatase LpxH